MWYRMSQVAIQGCDRNSLKHKNLLLQERESLPDRIGSEFALDCRSLCVKTSATLPWGRERVK